MDAGKKDCSKIFHFPFQVLFRNGPYTAAMGRHREGFPGAGSAAPVRRGADRKAADKKQSICKMVFIVGKGVRK